MQVPLPRTIVSLTKSEVEQPKSSSPDPVIVIVDRNTSKLFFFIEATSKVGAELNGELKEHDL